MTDENEDGPFRVTLVGAGGETAEGVFTLADDGGLCRLTLEYPGGTLAAAEDDYFEALCRIREALEARGLRPSCHGARRDVFPSPMGRDMGRGLLAYKLRPGVHAKASDLVGIFEGGPGLEPVTVADQNAFYEEWLRSPRRSEP